MEEFDVMQRRFSGFKDDLARDRDRKLDEAEKKIRELRAACRELEGMVTLIFF